MYMFSGARKQQSTRSRVGGKGERSDVMLMFEKFDSWPRDHEYRVYMTDKSRRKSTSGKGPTLRGWPLHQRSARTKYRIVRWSCCLRDAARTYAEAASRNSMVGVGRRWKRANNNVIHELAANARSLVRKTLRRATYSSRCDPTAMVTSCDDVSRCRHVDT